MHARFTPRAHRFVYRIFLFAFDLDELDELPRTLALFSLNRPNVYSFREADFLPTTEPRHLPTATSPGFTSHGAARKEPSVAEAVRLSRPSTDEASHRLTSARPPEAGSAPSDSTSPSAVETPATPRSLKDRVVAYAATHGVDLQGGRIVLVTLPRVFGYLFNPVSFYFCYDRHGAPAAAIAEVTNTFREVKPFFLGGSCLSATTGGGEFKLRLPKHFYVSPFSDVDVAFDFTLRTPGPRLSVQIDDYVGPDRTLTSTLAGPRRELTSGRLAWFTLKYPALTLRVIALIHWHALRLWLKRVPWFAKAARPGDQRDVFRPHHSIKPHPTTP
jgi:DUF1365 family protein